MPTLLNIFTGGGMEVSAESSDLSQNVSVCFLLSASNRKSLLCVLCLLYIHFIWLTAWKVNWLGLLVYQNKTSVDSTFSSTEMNMHELNAFEPGLRSSFKLNISLQCCLRCQALSLYMTTFFPYKPTWMVWHQSEKQPKAQTGFHLLSL